jgi:hypothetical protein
MSLSDCYHENSVVRFDDSCCKEQYISSCNTDYFAKADPHSAAAFRKPLLSVPCVHLVLYDGFVAL